MSNGLHPNDPGQLLRDAAASFTAAPGSSVWPGIEKAIQKKNRRKRMAWLFLLPLLLLPAGWWLVAQNKPANDAVQKPLAEAYRQPVQTPAAHIITEPATVSPATGSTDHTITKHNPAENITVQLPASPRIETPVYKPAVKPAIRLVNRNTGRYRAAINTIPVAKQEKTEEMMLAAAPPAEIPAATTETATVSEPVAEPETETAENPAPETEHTAPQNDQQPESLTEPDRMTEALPVPQMIKPKLPFRKPRFGVDLSFGAGFRWLHTVANQAKALNGTAGFAGGGTLYNRDVSRFNNLNHQPGALFGVGLAANIPLSRRWSIETGIAYQSQGYTMRAYEAGAVQIDYRSSGLTVNTVSADLNSHYVSNPHFASGSVMGTTTLKNRYHFIQVPVMAMYETQPAGRQSVFIKAGVVAKYLAATQSYIYSPETARYFTAPQSTTYRNWNLAAVLQPGFLFRLKNGNEIQLGLNIEFNGMPTHGNKITLRENLYNAGFSIGFRLGYLFGNR